MRTFVRMGKHCTSSQDTWIRYLSGPGVYLSLIRYRIFVTGKIPKLRYASYKRGYSILMRATYKSDCLRLLRLGSQRRTDEWRQARDVLITAEVKLQIDANPSHANPRVSAIMKYTHRRKDCVRQSLLRWKRFSTKYKTVYDTHHGAVDTSHRTNPPLQYVY